MQAKLALVDGGFVVLNYDGSGNVVGARVERNGSAQTQAAPRRIEQHTAVVDGSTKIVVDYDRSIGLVVKATWDGQEISNDTLMQRLEGLVRAVGLYA